MGKFIPKTELYGKPVFLMDRDDKETPIGKLDEIKSPHCFVVDGVEWEVDASYDFWDEKDRIVLWCAWK